MKKLRLNLIRLTNFEAQRESELRLDGKSVSICADNGTGKSSHADAITFLFDGKSALNEAEFGIKEIDPDTRRPIPNIDHTAYGEFDLWGAEDALQFDLQKTYAEVWGTERGIPVTKPKSHETSHFRNGVGIQESAYRQWLKDELADPEILRRLMDPYYFNDLHGKGLKWQDRRKTLLAMVGDVSQAEVIASNSELAELPALLGRYSIPEFQKVKGDERKKARDERDAIQPRISEQNTILQKAKPEAGATDLPSGARSGATGDLPSGSTSGGAALPRLRAELQALNEKRAGITSGGAIADKRLELARLQSRALEIENEAKAALGTAHTDALAEVRKAERELSEAENAKLALERNRATDLAAAAQLDKDLGILRTELEAARAARQAKREEQFEFTGTAICPTCERPLPAEAVALAVETARGNFNEAKAKWLEGDGIAGAARIAAIKAKEISNAEIEAKAAQKAKQIETAEDAIGELGELRDTTKAKAAALETPKLDLESNADYRATVNARVEIGAEIVRLTESSAEALAAADAEIAAVNLRITAATEAAALIRQQGEAREAIARHEAREEELARQIGEIDRGLKLCDLYTTAWVSLIQASVDAKFKVTRWKLFDVLVNGSISECCEATYLGKPPSEGFALDVGLDCINALSEFYGLAMPIVIDRAEKRTEFLPTYGQQIRFCVRGGAKEFELEFDEAREMVG